MTARRHRLDRSAAGAGCKIEWVGSRREKRPASDQRSPRRGRCVPLAWVPSCSGKKLRSSIETEPIEPRPRTRTNSRRETRLRTYTISRNSRLSISCLGEDSGGPSTTTIDSLYGRCGQSLFEIQRTVLSHPGARGPVQRSILFWIVPKRVSGRVLVRVLRHVSS